MAWLTESSPLRPFSVFHLGKPLRAIFKRRVYVCLPFSIYVCILIDIVTYPIHADSFQWRFSESVQKWHPGQMCGPFYLKNNPYASLNVWYCLNCIIITEYGDFLKNNVIPKPENPMIEAMSPSLSILSKRKDVASWHEVTQCK